MRATFRTGLLATSLLLASCSDDPVSPSGSLPETHYDVSLDFFSAPIRSLWGSSNGDMYASGSFILKNDGNQWQPMELPRFDRGFFSTWGTSNGDVYAIGNNNIHRFDGSQWHEIQLPASVNDVWGSDDGHIFVLGGLGGLINYSRRLYHYDGSTWSVDSLVVTTEPWNDPWQDISGGNHDDVYIAGWNGWLGHYDGHGWSATRPDSTRSWSSIWKAPDGPLYLTSFDSLFTYDGRSFTPVDLGESVWDVRLSGRSANEVYCLASGRKIFRFNGSNWERVAEMDHSVDVMWGERASDRLFAASAGVIWKLEGSNPTVSFGDAGNSQQRFFDLWGSEEDGIYLVGSYAYHYLDGVWTDLRKEDLTLNWAESIWGRSGHELYAVGNAMILHYDGEQWTWVSGGGQYHLLSVWGNDRDVFAVGAGGAILRLHDGVWSPMESRTSYHLFAVYAWSDRAFAGGQDGALIYYDGREWRPFPSPVSWDINDMFGFDNKIYAVGNDQSEICRYDGKTWEPISIEYSGGVSMSVWGTSERNLFIGKSDGNVVHFNGSEWSFLPRLTSSPIRSVWGTPGGEVITAQDRVVVRFSR